MHDIKMYINIGCVCDMYVYVCIKREKITGKKRLRNQQHGKT